MKKKASAAQLRITKDINELELPKTCRTEFPDPDDLLSFKLLISPDEVYEREIFSVRILEILTISEATHLICFEPNQQKGALMWCS